MLADLGTAVTAGQVSHGSVERTARQPRQDRRMGTIRTADSRAGRVGSDGVVRLERFEPPTWADWEKTIEFIHLTQQGMCVRSNIERITVHIKGKILERVTIQSFIVSKLYKNKNKMQCTRLLSRFKFVWSWNIITTNLATLHHQQFSKVF